MLNRVTHYFIGVAVIMVLVGGCRNSSANMGALKTADSLMNARQVKEALQQLETMDVESFDKDEACYYQLLLTLAKYKNYVHFQSDSAISEVVDYYAKTRDQRSFMRALIAQGCVNEDLGDYEKAVTCYNRAEEFPLQGDSADLAYAKLRLGSLYNNSFIGTISIALQKYREALSLYQAIGDQHYTLVCLYKVGTLYRNLPEKHDSAVLCLKSAYDLAVRLQDNSYQFLNSFSLSEYYLVRENDYRAAIRYGLQALEADKEASGHPKAHYRLAAAYLHLGQTDSARYFLRTAPKPVDAVDSIVYYDVMSQLEHANGNEGMSKHYLQCGHAIADSVTINGLNHKLLEIEKKYDLQEEELKNSQLQSRLRGTWLMLAAAIIAALLLALALLHYRHRLRLKQQEQEMLRADLDASVEGLRRMQTDLSDYKEQLRTSEVAYREQLSAKAALLQERERLTADLASLESKKRQSDELRGIVTQQIESVNQLMTWAYQHDAKTFARKFGKMMSITPDNDESYWINLHTLVNDLHDNVLERAQQAAGGTLNESELNLIALYCCGLSRTVIMLIMGYKSVGTVYNKKVKIERKLGVEDLKEFVKSR